MSQYVNFFIRKGDEFWPIADYSRSTAVYQVMRDAPYEKIQEYTYRDLVLKVAELKEMKEENSTMAARIRNRIEDVYHMDNSVEEKMEYVSDYYSQISDFEEENKILDRYITELEFISEMNYMGYTIYAGVEIGEPTLDDVVRMGE